MVGASVLAVIAGGFAAYRLWAARAEAESVSVTSGHRDFEGRHDAAILRDSLVALPEELAQVIEEQK